jgi:hypothetical protein
MVPALGSDHWPNFWAVFVNTILDVIVQFKTAYENKVNWCILWKHHVCTCMIFVNRFFQKRSTLSPWRCHNL